MKFRDFHSDTSRQWFRAGSAAGQSSHVQGRSGRKDSRRIRRLPQRGPRYQTGHIGGHDTTVGTAETRFSRASVSGGQRHRELMPLSVASTAVEQSTKRVSEELQSDIERRRTIEQGSPLLRRQIRNGLEVQRNRLLKGGENLLEGVALNRDIEIEADRLPVAITAFGVAAKNSRRQLRTFRTWLTQDEFKPRSPPRQLGIFSETDHPSR
jgi:hypothetical protein